MTRRTGFDQFQQIFRERASWIHRSAVSQVKARVRAGSNRRLRVPDAGRGRRTPA